MSPLETPKNRSRAQGRTQLQNSSSSDITDAPLRGALDDERKRRRFRQRTSKKVPNIAAAGSNGFRTADISSTNGLLQFGYFIGVTSLLCKMFGKYGQPEIDA